jgi:hypothetical protein
VPIFINTYVEDSRVMVTLLLLCELSRILLDASHLDSIELISDLKTNNVTLDRYYRETAKVLSRNSKSKRNTVAKQQR